METVFQRINRKCNEAKKKLIIITPVKKRRDMSPEPYLKEMVQTMPKGAR